jgi:signal transduction histidine kinase
MAAKPRCIRHESMKLKLNRYQISRALQDEIAQTLLGINVRLLSLKKEATLNTAGLQKEIASTQRLVVHLAESVRRVARNFRNA